MDLTRRSGVLLHPTSLPGSLGQGDIGPAAHALVGELARAGQTVWQVLPLGPPDGLGSPYAASSAFAGDPSLVSPELLVKDGLLERADLDRAPRFPEGRTSAGAANARRALLDLAAARFRDAASAADRADLEGFRERNEFWLEDHALFVALCEAHGRPYWLRWPDALRRHLPRAVADARAAHRDAIEGEVFRQWIFDRQWRRLRAHANALGVQVLGDVPIFVARDSSDVWARPELFHLDAQGEPTVVAGVPPDLFTEDGQLWGNPLFDWPIHARTGWAWWTERVRHTFSLVDILRIDHFRGFASYWEVPASAKTARGGRWLPGPGRTLFDGIEAALGELPIVAEDLGLVTDDVIELLEQTGFPGMKVLQFAFDGDPRNSHLPANHTVNTVVYPGTHDNETLVGWLQAQDPLVLETVRTVLARALPGVHVARHAPARDLAWGLIELGLSAPAFLAVTPAQDVLDLGNEARMNKPGTTVNNWSWRLLPGQLDGPGLERLHELTARHGRLGRKTAEPSSCGAHAAPQPDPR